jgi:peptidyl-prolyl cis-trans isomerase D
MAARVVEYKAAAPQPFDDVKAEIKRQLEQKAASELAEKAGKEKLALLEQGKDAGVRFGSAIVVARNQPQPALPPEARTKVFQVGTASLPAFVGANDIRGGYSIYKVLRVITPPPPDATRLAGFTSRVSDQVGRELFDAYMASLKSRGDVKINQTNLDKQTGDSEDGSAPPPGGSPRPSRSRPRS